MLLEPDRVLQFMVMPLVSAQLLLMVLIYFTMVRKRISTLYKWYFCFLATVIVFLLGRASQYFVAPETGFLILYARKSLLFSIGLPSLLIASALYTGVKRTYFLYITPYVLGVIFSIAWVVVLHSTRLHIVPQDFVPLLNDTFGHPAHRGIQLSAIFVLSIIPCSYFFIRAVFNFKSVKDLVVLLGAIIFGVLYALAGYLRDYFIIYSGAIIPALCWAWVVFKDISEMKGKVGLLKDELYDLVQSGATVAEDDVEKLLAEIEHLSSNNLSIYKLRLREILTRLTDNTIEAGGDSELLLSQHSEQEKALDDVNDAEQLRTMARKQVVSLSQIISEIPNQRIVRVQKYLTEHYQNDIDVDQLAEQFKVSRSYLMREFKKSTSQTINQFLTAHRIDIAKKLLMDHSVTETAFAVGFNNSNYFSTVFKKMTGKTPGQFQPPSS